MTNRLYHPTDVRTQEIDNIFVSLKPGTDTRRDFETGAIISDAKYIYYEIWRLVEVACVPSKISSFRNRIGNLHFIGVLRINIASGEADDKPQMAGDQYRRYIRHSADSVEITHSNRRDGTTLVRVTGAHHLNQYRERIRRNFLIANGYGLRDDI